MLIDITQTRVLIYPPCEKVGIFHRELNQLTIKCSYYILLKYDTRTNRCVLVIPTTRRKCTAATVLVLV